MEVYKSSIRNFLSVPSRVCTAVVIPAKAGIQTCPRESGDPDQESLDSRFRGNDKQEQKSIKKVMVFGVFDRLHPGHISFLKQAAGHGDELIAVVTRDDIVRQLKNKMPMHGEQERMRAIRSIAHVHRVVLGDAVSGLYDIIRTHQPDIICLGYDQQGLAEDLRSRMAQGKLMPVELMVMKPYQANTFHTSLLTDTA